MNLIVAGIGTEVGKTIVSAILCEALQMNYWKPVQAGDLDRTDSDKVRSLVSHRPFEIYPEAHQLTAPMSPHAAADRDGVNIRAEDFNFSQGEALSREKIPCIIELAGGLMVPLSKTYMMADLVEDLDHPVVLVANSYLGSINHTLLSLELIGQRKLNLLGIIFNGETNLDSRDVILEYSNVPLIADIPHADHINKDFIKTHADKIRLHPGLAQFR